MFLDPADDKDQIGTSATTDRRGEYRLRLRRGRYRWALLANHVRVPTVYMDTVQLSAPVVRLDYRYGGWRVEGSLVGPSGVPLRAGTVLAIGTSPEHYLIFPEGEIESGRYRLFLPTSDYWFHTAPQPACYPGREGGARVRIAADTTIDFSADGHLVTGRVTLRGSRPLRGARVDAFGKAGEVAISAHAVSRGDGGFELYLPVGDFGITAIPAEKERNIAWQSLHCRVDGPRSLTLELGETIWRGTVRDSAAGTPIRFVNVVATDTDKLRGSTLVSKTDGRGRFMFAPQRGRRYAMLVEQTRPSMGLAGRSGILAGNDSTFDLLVGNSRELTKNSK